MYLWLDLLLEKKDKRREEIEIEIEIESQKILHFLNSTAGNLLEMNRTEEKKKKTGFPWSYLDISIIFSFSLILSYSLFARSRVSSMVIHDLLRRPPCLVSVLSREVCPLRVWIPLDSTVPIFSSYVFVHLPPPSSSLPLLVWKIDSKSTQSTCRARSNKKRKNREKQQQQQQHRTTTKQTVKLHILMCIAHKRLVSVGLVVRLFVLFCFFPFSTRHGGQKGSAQFDSSTSSSRPPHDQ